MLPILHKHKTMSILSFRFIIIILIIGCYLPLTAQSGKQRPKESDILIEKIFIDATRQKILQNYPEAILKYLEVLQKEENNPVARYELAKLYLQEKKYDEAVLNAEYAITIAPENVLYNEQYASILEQTGELKKAAELYAKLIEKNPYQEYLYYKQAYFLTKNNKKDLAIKVYNSLEKKVGIKSSISLPKYKLYMGLNKLKKAELELTNLIKAYPNESLYMLKLANYYTSAKQYSKANDWYKKILEIDPKNPMANVALVSYFLQNGDTTRYLNALAPIFEDPNQSISAKLSTLAPLVEGLVDQKYIPYHSQIRVLSHNLIKAHPENTQANIIYAELFFQDKKYQKALKYYQIGLSSQKNNNQLWQRILTCLYKTRQKTKLLLYSTEMIELFPSQPYGYYYSGMAQLELKNYPKAEGFFLETIDIAVSDITLQSNAYSYLGLTYTLQNSYTKGEEAFKKSLEITPNNPDTKQIYAYSLALQATQLEKALNLIEEAINTDTDSPIYYTTKGLILYKKSQYVLAEKILDKAVNLGGSELPQTLEYSGDTAFKLGKIDLAVQFWQKALDKGSSSSILKRKVSTRQLYE